jgi:endo-1,4-beta-D-glucanase Y
MGRFPFRGTKPLRGAYQPKDVAFEDAWRALAAWREEIVTADGAVGFLRTRRPDTPDGVANSTVSEGIAYGMMIAVFSDDQPLFDALWRYALYWSNKNGLMDWYIAPDGSRALGVGGATDSDEDMAWALVMADRQWGGQGSLDEPYLRHARRQIARLGEFEVDHSQFDGMLLPGDDWRGRDVFNPSYFAPHQYRIFGQVSGEVAFWGKVIDKGYETLEKSLNEQSGNHENGLVPAWCTSQGEPVEAFPGALTNYQYDSARTPFRLAQDYIYNGEPRALRYLQRVSAFFAAEGADQIVDGYTLRGAKAPDPKASQPNPGSAVFVASAGIGASVFPEHEGFVDDCYRRVAKGDLLARSRYYNHSWTVLALLFWTGHFFDLPEQLHL